MNWLRFALAGVVATAAAAQTDAGLDFNNRGNEAVARGDYAEAERLFGEALKVWEPRGPAFEAHRAAALFNLGVALSSEGKRGEAGKAYEQALDLHRHALGPKHIRTLATMNLLAGVYTMLGDHERAEALFDEALAVERELYPNDVQLARTLAGLASIRMRSGRAGEAMPLAEEALRLTRTVMGDDSLDTAVMYGNVAEAHRIAGRSERALPLYRKAGAIYERLLGPTHPRVAGILSQEGLILLEDGKPALAEQILVRAVEMLRKFCPNCIVEQAVAENNLALLRLAQKKYAEAGRLLTEALSLQEQYSLQPGRDMANTLRSLALVREKQQRHEEAVRLKSRADLILAYR